MKHFILISVFFFSGTCFADFESYDEIVDKLSQYNESQPTVSTTHRPERRTFSRAHIGLGLSQTFFDADAVGFDSSIQNQGGLSVNIGVDILNAHWGLEGSFANFGTQTVDSSVIKLREFAIKGLYKPSLNKSWTMRMGLGVSSRFLDINNPLTSESYKTPSGLFIFGLDSYISRFISVGADISFKTAMIDDTIDNNSVDVAFRVDTHF